MEDYPFIGPYRFPFILVIGKMISSLVYTGIILFDF